MHTHRLLSSQSHTHSYAYSHMHTNSTQTRLPSLTLSHSLTQPPTPTHSYNPMLAHSPTRVLSHTQPHVLLGFYTLTHTCTLTYTCVPSHIHTYTCTHTHTQPSLVFVPASSSSFSGAFYPTCTGSPWTPSDATTLKPPTALKASLHPTVGGGSGEESEHLLGADLGDLMACSQDPSQAGVPSCFSNLQTKAR